MESLKIATGLLPSAVPDKLEPPPDKANEFAILAEFLNHYMKSDIIEFREPTIPIPRCKIRLFIDSKNTDFDGKKISEVKFIYYDYRDFSFKSSVFMQSGYTRRMLPDYTLKITFSDGQKMEKSFCQIPEEIRNLIEKACTPASIWKHRIDDLLLNYFLSFSHYLSSNNFELDLTQYHFPKAKPPEFWASDWHIARKTALVYRIVYNEIIETIKKLLVMRTITDTPLILDAGCGKGDLLLKLQTELAPYTPLLMGIEADTSSCVTARAKNPDLEIFQADLLRTKDLFVSGRLAIDLIIFSGILTKQVQPDKKTAMQILSEAVTFLKPGGYVLLDGLQDNFLRKKDFEKLGLIVIQTYDVVSERVFIILQKPN